MEFNTHIPLEKQPNAVFTQRVAILDEPSLMYALLSILGVALLLFLERF
jgi:hypothetical protein